MLNLLDILKAPEAHKSELSFIFEHLISEDSSYDDKEKILLTLNSIGITYEHLASLSKEVLKFSTFTSNLDNNYIDTCGTGGSGKSIFNCSTLSAFTVAACGGKVIKHGNRSITSKSGSADFLERAGINLQAPTDQVLNIYKSMNIAFLFAPNQHPKIKNVAEVRKNIGVRTIFNVLGPLVNPSKPRFQLLGTSDKKLNKHMAKALQNNGIKRGMVVTSFSDIDEVCVHEPTFITEINGAKINEWELDPKNYGFDACYIEDIQVNSLEEAYLFGIEILNGKRGPGLDMVALNSGLCLYLLGIVSNLEEGISLAKKELLSGRVLLKLNMYAKSTNQWIT